MECENPVVFQEWVARWGDLVDIDIIPVAQSSDTSTLTARMAGVSVETPDN